MPKIRIHTSNNNQYYWVLYATNGEAICWSEQYTSRYSAIESAHLAKRLMINAEILS